MDYNEFDKKLSEIKLSKKDFSKKVGVSYSGVTNWSQVAQVPVWVESWLENYKNSQKFNKIKEMIKDDLD